MKDSLLATIRTRAIAAGIFSRKNKITSRAGNSDHNKRALIFCDPEILFWHRIPTLHLAVSSWQMRENYP